MTHPHRREELAGTVQWARDLLERDDWLILDTETTSLDGYCVEVAVVRPDGTTVFESLVHPQWYYTNHHISPNCSQGKIDTGRVDIHGITPEMVKDSPTFNQLEPQLRRLLHGKLVVTYNVAFDRKILWNEIYRKVLLAHAPGEKFPSGTLRAGNRRLTPIANRAAASWVGAIRWQCAMERYATFVGHWSHAWGGYKYQPLRGGHRAAGDCRACLEVMRKMAARKCAT